MGHGMTPGIHLLEAADRYGGAGGDDTSVRLLTGTGPPVTAIPGTS